MSAKEIAAEIRKDLKKLGYTPRQVSVRSEYFSMGSSVSITVKDITCDFDAIDRIARSYERIRRCEYTGEILSGGNTYVSVSWDWALRQAVAEPYLSYVKSMPEGVSIEVVPGALFYRMDTYIWYHGDTRIGGAEQVAFTIARLKAASCQDQDSKAAA